MKKTNQEEFTTEKLSVEMLKLQNISLTNKLDRYMREYSSLSKNKQKQDKQIKNYECLISHFLGSFKEFMLKLENIHILVKNKTDSKLTQKFPQCFELLLEVTAIHEKINQETTDFSKFTQEKVKSFVKSFTNIYTELLIEQGKYNEQQLIYLQTLSQNQDIQEVSRKIFQESMETKKQYKEYEAFFKEKSSYLQYQGVIECDLQYDKISQLTDENEDLKYQNENLTRRTKLLREYNINSILKKIEMGEQVEIDLQGENFECICGGNQVAYLQNLAEKISSLNQENFQVKHGDDTCKMDIEHLSVENQVDHHRDNGDSIYNLKVNEKITNLELQVMDITQQKTDLHKEIKKLKLQEKNYEEFLFKSNVFQNLVQQGQDLMRYSQNLKNQLQNSYQRIEEIEKQRDKEIIEFQRKENDTRLKLLQEINTLKLNKAQFEVTTGIQELLNQANNSSRVQSIIERNDELQRVIEQLQSQITVMKQKEVELRQVCEFEAKTKNEYMDKFDKLNQIYIVLESKLPEGINLQNINFRHSKIKECLLEIDSQLQKNSINMKEKINEIVNYIRTRESKINSQEEKINQFKTDINQKNRTLDSLLAEMENTETGFNDLRESNKNLTQLLKKKEENEGNLIQEKFKEKIQADQDKKTFNIRIMADQEQIHKQQKIIEEDKILIETLQTQMESLQLQIEIQQEKIAQNNQNRDELFNQLDFKKQEYKLQLKKVEDLEQSQGEIISKYEASQSELCKMQQVLNLKVEQLNSQDSSLQQLELDKYKEMVNCQTCSVRMKKIILIKCAHMFCKDCIDNNMKVRNRACPICRTRFDYNDVKQIFW